MKRDWLVVLFLVGLLYSCDTCEKCGEPLVFDPIVKAKFIDRDSLIALDADLALLSDSIDFLGDTYDSLNTKVKAWNNKLIALRDSIENGQTQYVADTVKYTDSVTVASALLVEADTLLDNVNEWYNELDDARDVVVSGKVRLHRLMIQENGNSTTYADSATTYRLPLLMEGYDITTFEIALAGDTNTLAFSYETDLLVNADREVEMRAYDIDLISSSYPVYDTLTTVFECETNDCLDNEVLVTIYF